MVTSPEVERSSKNERALQRKKFGMPTRIRTADYSFGDCRVSSYTMGIWVVWRTRRESNPRPLASDASALPLSYEHKRLARSAGVEPAASGFVDRRSSS